MFVLKNPQECCGCHSCFNACPVQAIHMRRDQEGFWYPQIEDAKCIHCNRCRIACPILNPPVVSSSSTTYAAWARDPAIRQASASGGLFALLAQRTLSHGGIVWGAAFNQALGVEHQSASTSTELTLLKGSKYVQSTIGDCFKQIKQDLLKQRPVLFSGTPCQVAGLKAFLKKPDPHLLTLDLVCHGVPSEKIWHQYLRELGHGAKPIAATFRDKSRGLKHVKLEFGFANGRKIRQDYSKNIFIKGFIGNLFLRPSCSDCHFKGENRCSDLTLGDFWGVEQEMPGFVDNFGCSLVLTHSEAGEAALKDLQNEIALRSCPFAAALKANGGLLESSISHPMRAKFFAQVEAQGMIKLVKEFTKIPFITRFQRGLFAIKYNVKYFIYRTLSYLKIVK